MQLKKLSDSSYWIAILLRKLVLIGVIVKVEKMSEKASGQMHF